MPFTDVKDLLLFDIGKNVQCGFFFISKYLHRFPYLTTLLFPNLSVKALDILISRVPNFIHYFNLEQMVHYIRGSTD